MRDGPWPAIITARGRGLANAGGRGFAHRIEESGKARAQSAKTTRRGLWLPVAHRTGVSVGAFMKHQMVRRRAF